MTTSSNYFLRKQIRARRLAALQANPQVFGRSVLGRLVRVGLTSLLGELAAAGREAI